VASGVDKAMAEPAKREAAKVRETAQMTRILEFSLCLLSLYADTVVFVTV